MDAVVYLGLWDPESKFRATSLVLLQRPYVLSIAEASKTFGGCLIVRQLTN